MNYYEHHIGDYNSATSHLSWIEDMAYTRLIRLYYRTESPIPADIAQACRLVRAATKSERNAVASVLGEFFTLEDDGWHQKRCDEDIAKYLVKQNKARASAQARWDRSDSEGNANASITHSEGNTHQTPDTRPKQKTSQGFATLTPEPVKPVLEIIKPHSELLPAEPSQLNHGNTRARVATSGPTWDAYAGAYRRRYGVDPVRNKTVNAQLSAFVQRIGASESPAVAAWYVQHNNALYVRAKHPSNLLLRDAEGLRTEWATGQMVTDGRARQIDRKQTNANAFSGLIAEAEAKEVANGKP